MASPPRQDPEPLPRSAWLIGPAILAAIGLGLVLVRADPFWLFMGAIGLAVGSALVWIAASSLWPATADRRCPVCGEDSLVRLDPLSTRGLSCSACGHTDESASSFLLAEEEGAIEPIVLHERDADCPRTATTPEPHESTEATTSSR